MKILVYGINFFPELTGIGKYTGEMCFWLASRGHEVEVITGHPYYPQWKVKEGYEQKYITEIIKGVKVKRTPLYVPEKITGFSRVRHEISFVLNSFAYWSKAFFTNYDVVIGICPPLQTGIFPILYKFIRRKPVIFHIQDLQVDAAKDLGLIKNKLILNTLIGIERFIVKNATKVSSISDGMKKKILEKGISEDKYIHLPNWSDIEFVRPMSKEESLRKELGISPDTFVILYSGNMGDKQGLNVVLEAAAKMKDQSGVIFLMAGEGSAKTKLLEEAERLNLSNIRFIGLQPYEKLSAFLATADLHLVVQKAAASDLVLPSKLISILSAGGVPLVTAVPGSSLYKVIDEEKVGILVEPENADSLYAAINCALNDNLTEMRKRARLYAEKELSIDYILSNFETTLENLTAVKRVPHLYKTKSPWLAIKNFF